VHALEVRLDGGGWLRRELVSQDDVNGVAALSVETTPDFALLSG